MESIETPFVCTTNRMHSMDKAAMRRFVFKIEMRPLTTKQALIAFERFFGFESIDVLPVGLTAGDFANVAHKVKLMAETERTIIQGWIFDEMRAKEGGSDMKIGFHPASSHSSREPTPQVDQPGRHPACYFGQMTKDFK